MTKQDELIKGIAIDEIESDPILTEGEDGDDSDDDDDDDDEDADEPESEDDARGDL